MGNPPDGAILTYYLKSASSGPVTLAIYDSGGKLVRELTNVPPPTEPEPQLNVPNYWIERPHPLTTAAGMNRAVWDLRYTHPTPIAPYGTRRTRFRRFMARLLRNRAVRWWPPGLMKCASR